MSESYTKLIPQIWQNTILRSIYACLEMSTQLMKEWEEQHQDRMANDPEYARRYEQKQAEDEAWGYWQALYDNQPQFYDEDEDY